MKIYILLYRPHPRMSFEAIKAYKNREIALEMGVKLNSGKGAASSMDCSLVTELEVE